MISAMVTKPRMEAAKAFASQFKRRLVQRGRTRYGRHRQPSRARGGDSLIPVITGELKSKVDSIWDAFWSGGISNRSR